MTSAPPSAGLEPADPSERGGTRVDGVEVLGALSPSRVGDFLNCPLLYRFRSIDRLPEPASPAAVRGTVVHRVLEQLFDLPAGERVPSVAETMIAPAWTELQELEPAVTEMFPADGPEIAAWLESCRDVLARYFDLEDPRQLEPADRELYVETLTDSKLLLRGVIDRVDVAPDGSIRICDYKTGPSPSEMFEGKALFQLKFYALVLWRMRGVVPRMLQLVYLGNSEVLRYEPDEQDLLATERKVLAVWDAIRTATEKREFEARKGAGCRWCAHQALCPAYDGTPPPYPVQD
ncbi:MULTISPECIES: RecB family exonuclease [unclassified Nocardioides]|uniref:RecB family exonuclease n=1 Tax=unclassified Nocardioides TaxID=2615069 RepID=UPI000703013D|nr:MULTISPECIES: RecB family exonuclease [unclassified Nocardioides]KRC50222.1 recombinase RecB [Nocardioides sp. Root79]KRC75689.1 recombinase RecB [Nocardioides sp. Root240]